MVDLNDYYYSFNFNECNYYHASDTITNPYNIDNLSSNNFSILHINSRSLLNKIDDLILLLGSFNFKFSIIAISETWLNSQTQPLARLDGYRFEGNVRGNKRGGGVGLFIINSLNYTLNNDDINNPCIESISVSLMNLNILSNLTHSKANPIRIIIIYRPPNTEFSNFLYDFEQILTGSNRPTYIIGDFNINLDYDNKDKLNFEQLFFSYNFSPLINLPTRVSSHSASLLDNILTNIVSTHTSGVVIHDLSDHYPIFSISKDSTFSVTGNIKTFSLQRNFSKLSIEKIKRDLRSISWQPVVTESDVDTSYEQFFRIFSFILDAHAPLKSINVSKYKKSWVNKDVIKLSKIKSRLFKRSVVQPSETSMIQYKNFRNFFTRYKRNKEKAFYNSLFADGDIKHNWRAINEILNKTKPNISIPKLNYNNATLNDATSICNALNHSFIDTINRLHLGLSNSSAVDELVIGGEGNKCSLFLDNIEPSEIISVINRFKPNKSCSSDGLNMFIIKLFLEEIVFPLTHFCNLSLQSGKFPNAFKMAKVLPIFKKGKRDDPGNYRPISLLSPLSKVLEHLIATRMKSFMAKYKLMSNNQYGFRPNHSTELAILELYHRIINKLDDKHLTIGIFIDLTKAFDIIDHNLLLLKLNFYGFRGKILSWLTSYLSNRNQFVSLDCKRSVVLPVKYGVPQGSILGPLLFTIYINDFPNVTTLFKCIMFADDTNIFHSSKAICDDMDLINADLKKIESWFSMNKLIINTDKSFYTIFGPSILTNNIPDLSLKLNNILLRKSNSVKFLGVHIQCNLSWSTHILTIRKKIHNFLCVLNKMKHKFNLSTKIKLYYSFIFPHLIYCNIIWGNGPEYLLKLLVGCQKRFLRIIFNSKPTDHTEILFARSKILSILQINLYLQTLFTFKFLKNLLPPYYSDFFQYSNPIKSIITRQNATFYIKTSRLNLINNCISHTAPKIWHNVIPLNIQNIDNLTSFKKNLKTFSCTYKPP